MLSFAIHKHLNSCFPHNVLEMMSLFANWNTAGTSLVSLSEDLNFRSIHCANCTVMSTGSLIFSFVLFIALCWVLLVFGLCVIIAFTAIHRRAQVKVMVELATRRLDAAAGAHMTRCLYVARSRRDGGRVRTPLVGFHEPRYIKCSYLRS